MKEGKILIETAEKVNYISEYIVAYKAKIEALNKKGLFDTATLYEIFAQEICKLWFGQKFLNLNVVKPNFPYVDLISEDNKLYVQVSTIQDIPLKVKSTLEKIRDSKSRELKDVKKLFFFVISNDSVNDVKDYTGEFQIGSIAFTKKDNLITTDDIIQKAKTDIKFQTALYDFLQSENDLLIQIGDKFEKAITLSKALINNNIDYFINDEYIIDRSEEIKQIQEDNLNFISIQGEAGSGKSALCKIMLENEELLLYARAEKISEARSLEDIWGVNVDKVAKYIGQKKLVIYIDALEFIADGAKTKLDTLQQIYETVKGYNNIYVVTSCRSCDRTAFVKIENIYKIKKYDISLLTDNQIIGVAKKYKIIQELWSTKSYIQLLRSPFYLNLIIKEIKDSKKIEDVDSFRNLIWTQVICMSGKQFLYGIKTSDIRNAVEKIVFDRAKKFLLGVRKEEVGEEIVNILQSENIITSCADNTIRLKYDIFEDICFERFIDEKYDDCKNEYDVFFSNLMDMGRCIYRRYQIWVENKLFSKGNREKFLYKLLETNKIPTDWKEQTMIGIVKSNFCSEFFEEYADSISGDLLWEFVRLTNNFAFETTIINLKYENVYSKLEPIGIGRSCLINIIFNSGIYKENGVEKKVLKLCEDYSQNFENDDAALEHACSILEFYIEEKMHNSLQENQFHLSDDINICLMPIYRMALKSKGWIKHFWEERISGYLSIEDRKHHLDEEIIKYILKNTIPALALQLPEDLCKVADTYWIKNPQYDKNAFCYSQNLIEDTEECGLSRKAGYYSYEYKKVYENGFLNVLVQYNWIVALEWLIRLTNHVADSIKALSPESVYNISVWENSPNEGRNFIYNPIFWLVGIQENRVHALLSDGIYLFTQKAIREINSEHNDKTVAIKFADYIKSKILQEANNIMMLSVIAEIGRNCEEVILGYSAFLASSIELVMLDSQKIGILSPDSNRQLYEKLVLMSVGIPEIKQRYDIKVKSNDSLQDITIKMQLLGGEYKEKAEKRLDYLYSIIPNKGDNARQHLQIQKMDLRNAAMNKVDEHTYAVIPKVTGAARKIVEENAKSKYNRDKDDFQKIISYCNSLMVDGKFELQDCFETITKLQDLIESTEVPGQLQNVLIMIIAYVLAQKEITLEEHSRLCNIWLDGIDSIFNNGIFAFEIGLVKVLYRQIEFELDFSVKEKMKRQMLNCLLYKGQQGIIPKITSQLKGYLPQNKKLAKNLFYTIIAISEDKKTNYKYNLSKLNEMSKNIEYQPNRGKPPIWVKEIFEKNEIEFYQSSREEIIKKLLVNEEKKDLSTWNIEDSDIQTLCYISNCGLNFEDEEFRRIMGKIFPYILSIIASVKDYYEYLDAYAIGEVKEFINNELTGDKYYSAIIDMLFDFPDFAQMNSDVYELYEDISCHLLTVYFDGYDNKAVRKKCEVIMARIENKIALIADENVKHNLYVMMFLTLGKYHMHDWNELQTKYSYKDKMFLNNLWAKYGWLYLKNLLYVIDQMHITELLPEVIIPINESFQKCKHDFSKCEKVIINSELVINKIITKAFLDFNDDIKADKELMKAFEEFLEMLIEFNIEEAAVILDEFRVH